MTTTAHIRTAPLVVLLASTLLLGRPVAPAHAAHAASFAPQLTRTLGHGRPVAPSYGWPVKPFDRQHPVRAFLDDPRIGERGGRAFHFGIDVAAPDGTPVYAVTGGQLYLSHGSLAVQSGPRHTFGYWHIRAAAGLRDRQLVSRHQLLGTIAPGWGHVHFAERIGDEYVNPLRPGGLGPYTDPLPPTVGSLSVARGLHGLQLVVRAWDTTWPPVPGAWQNEPVTPALLQWRCGPGPWHTVADFRGHMLDRRLYSSVFAPATTQNHEGRPGTFAFYLSRSWKPADGTYRIEVAAADTRGNRTVAHFELSVSHQEVQS